MSKDTNELKHYGVLGMHWGVRKVEKLKGRSKRGRGLSDTQKRYAEALRKRHRAFGPLANAYTKSAGHHESLSNGYDELARRVFNKPYDSRNKPLHITTFEKVVIGLAGAISVGLAKPTIDMFGSKIRDYVSSKAGAKVVETAAEIAARRALGG